MLKIGLIKEGKIPADNRVAFTPKQCRMLKEQKGLNVVVESSDIRCFTDDEYRQEGIEVVTDISDCDILFGIKEVPAENLIAHKIYFFFSHTRKMQPYNQKMFRSVIDKKITLIDYENLEHEDGTRLLGFGFFAGVVGAHNGMLAYGNRTRKFKMERIYNHFDFQELSGSYFDLKLPNLRIVVTGSGRVAHGILKVMALMGMREVEPEDFLSNAFSYPVYTNLKGVDLYENIITGGYDREEFHERPEKYRSLFRQYLKCTDILLNGVYWENSMPRLFEMEDLDSYDFNLQTISDVTDDKHGSIPCNLGDVTIEEMVYGVSRKTGEKTEPYLPGSVDVLAVGNLPNELPRDASRYFGEQLIKYIMDDLQTGSPVLEGATMTKEGVITERFSYLKEYAEGLV